MAETVNIAKGEWKLMRRLWERAPQTIMQLYKSIREEAGWTKATVITLLKRLEAKGAVYYADGGKARLYYPAVSAQEVAEAETDSFLERVYDGRVGLMMSAMVEGRKLTDDDIAELRRILDTAKEDQYDKSINGHHNVERPDSDRHRSAHRTEWAHQSEASVCAVASCGAAPPDPI